MVTGGYVDHLQLVYFMHCSQEVVGYHLPTLQFIPWLLGIARILSQSTCSIRKWIQENANNVKIFLECSWYFSRMRLYMFYIVVRFQTPSFLYFPRYEFFSRLNFCQVSKGQTESDASKPTVHKHTWAKKSATELLHQIATTKRYMFSMSQIPLSPTAQELILLYFTFMEFGDCDQSLSLLLLVCNSQGF